MFVVAFDADDFQRGLRAASRAEWRWEVAVLQWPSQEHMMRGVLGTLESRLPLGGLPTSISLA